MFRALGRWIKAVGYLLTGQIDAARRTLDTNPHVMRAKYDEILREKTSRIHQYKQAVAGLIAQQENKMQKVKTLTDEVQRLENLKSGALAKAKQKVEELQRLGKTTEEVQKDEDYLRCQAAFKDFSSTLAEKQARIEELEADINDYGKRIGDHKVQLQSLLRELDQVARRAAPTPSPTSSRRARKRNWPTPSRASPRTAPPRNCSGSPVATGSQGRGQDLARTRRHRHQGAGSTSSWSSPGTRSPTPSSTH